MLLLLLSAMAIGLFFLVDSEGKVGGQNLENNLAFYGAEGAMEKMTSDLSDLFAANQAPTLAQIQALGQNPPTINGINYVSYQYNAPADGNGNVVPQQDNIHSGPYQGLVAEIVPVSLDVVAQRGLGAQVHMNRNVEVAMIPVFQFGVFSQSDLSYFPGPYFNFAGRVHTNGNLFLATGSDQGLVFRSKISAVGEVVRDQLANGVDSKNSNHGGPVYIPNGNNGCDVKAPDTNCLDLDFGQGSVIGGVNGSPNGSWVNISTQTFKSWIINNKTGAVPLNLPFVTGNVSAAEIIRRPPPAGQNDPASTSRLYNEAQIRVLLADTQAGLHDPPYDADDVQIDMFGTYAGGILVDGTAGGNTFFATANTTKDAGFYHPAGWRATDWSLLGGTGGTGGWLRVEVRYSDGTWHGVTREWLARGFARGLATPDSEHFRVNGVNPNAILILQMQADRNGDGSINSTDNPRITTGAGSQYSWYPINLYDPREGEVRDVTSAGDSCSVNGVMNAVEIDVGNLRKWLRGTIGTTGTSVDTQAQNGYVLYFSDRRGMIANPNIAPSYVNGEYGWEDVINSTSPNGTPDQKLEPNNPGTTQSPEDPDQNAKLDNWGAANVGIGFGVNTNAPLNAYGSARIACSTLGRKNSVTGARHALKLVNGSLGNLPEKADGTGGFTVGSENPVYVQGNYNANDVGYGAGNANAAVIADAVTLLSNNWYDGADSVSTRGSMLYPTNVGQRDGKDTWYRMAIAAGKNINFPQPGFAGVAADYGTDGGVHNFLRYIESWSGTLNYNGSLVSLFYSQYATGIFKCCTVVYSPPNRAYQFDVQFLVPANLPPATPLFRDVENVAYRQDFTPY